MPHTRKQTCPECGGNMVFETREDRVEYGELATQVPLDGWWCTKCPEAIFNGPELAKAERARAELKAQAENVLKPLQIADIRRKLGLSQRQAGELLGGGPRAFQKYERGTQTPSTMMSHLLVLLSNDPSRLREITEPRHLVVMCQVPKRPRTPAASKKTATRRPSARGTSKSC
jgi:HTH-type transcriptional regulator / antitoxin MqsA